MMVNLSDIGTSGTSFVTIGVYCGQMEPGWPAVVVVVVLAIAINRYYQAGSRFEPFRDFFCPDI